MLRRRRLRNPRYSVPIYDGYFHLFVGDKKSADVAEWLRRRSIPNLSGRDRERRKFMLLLALYAALLWSAHFIPMR